MRRWAAVLGSAMFLVIAPGTIAGLEPWWISRWSFQIPSPRWLPLRFAGALLILAALPVLLDSFARFALEGLRTPAPVFPTKHLLVRGLYPYVRNPMYIAVAALIVGQGLLFGNLRVLEYGAAVWLAFHVFVLAYEEPTLRGTFAEEYRRFRANRAGFRGCGHGREIRLFIPNQPVQAQRSSPGARQQQKNEAIEHREFAAVCDRPESMWRVLLEIGHSHFAAQDECHRARIEAEQNQHAAERFQDTRHAQQRQQMGGSAMAHAAEESEQFLEAVQPEREAGRDSQ